MASIIGLLLLPGVLVPEGSAGKVRAEEPANATPGAPQEVPIPRVQVIPLPRREASFQVEGKERLRYLFDRDQERPFLYPLVGPGGHGLTRLGHPRDPEGHSHHNSVWISHANVDGVDFWSDRGLGVIAHQKIVRFDDSPTSASLVSLNHWLATGREAETKNRPPAARVLLIERRRITLEPLANEESLVTLDLEFIPFGEAPVVFHESPFGLLGVRMAKTIGVNDGGGTIRNAAGNVGEQGENGCFRKPARWCDYSGPVAPGHSAGIALFDHPENVSHPTPFHVRADGWMGACLSHAGARQASREKPLRLRYALYLHAGVPALEKIEAAWQGFAKTSLAPLPEK